MSKILIAGCAGFIGSNLSRRLIDGGDSVVGIDNFITGSKSNIDDLEDHGDFTFIEYDVSTSLEQIKESIGKIDKIYHLASPASPNKNSERSYINYPIETLVVNSVGTHNLLKLAKDLNAAMLFASTSEVYGDPEISPQKETYFGNVNPNGTRSVYDESKRFGEAISMAYVRKFDTDVRIVRIFNTYGENMHKDDGRVISNFINQALEKRPISVYGDGFQTRSFCYIKDMVDGLIGVMEESKTRGEVINLGNPDEYKVNEIAVKIKELINSSSKIIHEDLPEDDPKKRKPDISKAKDLIGFNPKIDLDTGLNKTIEYFKKMQ